MKMPAQRDFYQYFVDQCGWQSGDQPDEEPGKVGKAYLWAALQDVTSLSNQRSPLFGSKESPFPRKS